MDDLVGGVFVLPRWLAPWRVRRETPSAVVERPPESRRAKPPINEYVVERVWEDYFVHGLKHRGLTKGELHRAKGLFVNTLMGGMVRFGDVRKALEHAEKAIQPYIKARTKETYVEKCDFCGRPTDANRQCLGCGVWRKQYR